MLLFGIFGAVLGMSEEVIPFVALVIPLAKSLGYDKMVGVCMVYVAAHVGFAGAMLNPFTVGVAQDMISVPLFSGIGYRTFCWALLMLIAFIFVLWYASKKRTSVSGLENGPESSSDKELSFVPCGRGAIVTFVLISISLVLFSVFYADECVLSIGQSKYSVPWLLWTVSILFVFSSLLLLRKDLRMYILNLLGFTILFMVIGVMGYAWYLPEICALFLAMAIASGLSAGYTSDKIAREFIAGAKDIFGAALVIGFAAGIIVILEDGNVMDTMLTSIASALEDVGKIGALGVMYAIQTFINIFIPSATAKAAITMPVMAPFADLIGVSRQATVLAFQFGDGFTNMITPCSGVLMAVLSVAKISYADWFSFIWKFILVLIVLGFVLLIPTAFLNIPGF